MINSSFFCYMLIVGQDVDMIQKLKMELSKTFDMKDLEVQSVSWEWRFHEIRR